MNMIYIVNQLPYPPRNGETLPTFNDIKEIRKHDGVSLILLNDDNKRCRKEEIEKNKSLVKDLWVVKRKKMHKAKAIINEITLRNPFYLSWCYDGKELKKIFAKMDIKVIWVSPFVNADIIFVLRKIVENEAIFVCVAHDCTTATYRSMSRFWNIKTNMNVGTRLNGVQRWLRSWLLGAMESRILGLYDTIVVQTKKDEEWLNKISRNKLEKKVLCAPNGVEGILFEIPIYKQGNDILYFGSLGEWAEVNFVWFLENVWIAVRNFDEDTRLNVVSRKVTEKMRRKLAMDKRIRYFSYVEDIREVFQGKALSVAPMFKNFGLINKVIESMAAGVPVVGDIGCFNGIPGFFDGVHGHVANDKESMIRAIKRLLGSEQERLGIAKAARKLVKEHFSWEKRNEIMMAGVSSALSKKYR
jgi:glycosyltransferase involved in cell wall biosynthesis